MNYDVTNTYLHLNVTSLLIHIYNLHLRETWLQYHTVMNDGADGVIMRIYIYERSVNDVSGVRYWANILQCRFAY